MPDPDDLGDKGAGIDRKRKPQGKELRRHLEPALEIETLLDRIIQGDRETLNRQGQERQADDQAQHGPPDREDLPRFLLALAGPDANEEADDNRQDQGDDGITGAVFEDRTDELETAVAQKADVADGNGAVANFRQAEENAPPKDDLQEQRNVTQTLDVAIGQARDHPVAGKAEHADGKADEGRGDAADEGHQQGIERAHQIDPGMAHLRIIVDHGKGDVKAGRAGKEPETRGDASLFQIHRRVVNDEGNENCQEPDDDHLRQDRPKFLVGEQPAAAPP